MSPDEKNALTTRLDRLKREIYFLKKHQPQTVDVLIEDEVMLRSIERSLEVALEAVLDIGRLMISLKGLEKPETNSEIFDVLAKAAIIPEEFAQKIRGIGNLRNILVHEYTGIDYDQLFDVLTNLTDLELFTEYIAKTLS